MTVNGAGDEQVAAAEVVCVRRPNSTWTVCRCGPCLAEQVRLNKRWRSGRWVRVSADAAWVRLDEMVRAGWTPLAISSASGVSARTLQKALADDRLRGERVRWGANHAAKIVNAGKPTGGAVSAVGVRRRLRALACLGWSLDELATRTGASPMALSYIRSGRTLTCAVRIVDAVAAAYEGLSMCPGGSATSTRYAEAQGWVPPLCWDEDTLDDPAALPWTEAAEGRDPLLLDDVAISRRLGGDVRVRLSAAEKREALRRGLARGMSENELLRNLKMSWRSAAAAKAATPDRQTARAS